MKLATSLLLVFAGTTAAQDYGVYFPCYPTVDTQCQPYCQPYYGQPYQYQRPPRRPAPSPEPDGIPTPPVGSEDTPQFDPSPPQPLNPPISDKPATPPQQTQIDKLQAELGAIQTRLGTIKSCDCNGCCEKLRAELNAKIENLATMQVQLRNELIQQQNTPPATPNYDVIAAEMQQRLKHSATITLLDGSKKTQTKPLGEPLEFIQHSRGLK